MSDTYIPLVGTGSKPKAPKVQGWSSDDFVGVERTEWVGLRCDDIVVVDCDTQEAAETWLAHVGDIRTKVVKTSRGVHFYYKAVPGGPTGPSTGVMEDIDIRAGKGSYVVVPPTPGYTVVSDHELAPFQVEWVPSKDIAKYDQEWDEIPEGRRNETLVNLAGGLRRQGMDADTIAATLLWWNRHGLVNPPLSDDELYTIARSSARYTPSPDWEILIEGDISSASMEDMFLDMRTMELPPPAEWHWRPYLPVGRLVLMDGSEGIGKGLLCARIATDMVRDGIVGLWGTTEDDPEEDVQKRLLAAGYDRAAKGNVLFFKVHPSFPQDADVLERVIETTKAGFMILDPGRSFLAPPHNVKSFSFNDESSIRPGLEALNKLAKRTKCTIIFVHHWNKNTQTTIQYRAGGSAAFAQVVRHRITLAWVGPTAAGEGAFEVSKSNIGPRGHVHSYTVEEVDEYDTARLVLGGPEEGVADLAEWLSIKEIEANSIDIDMTDEVLSGLMALEPGAKIPTRDEIAQKYNIKRAQAGELLAEMESLGEIRRSGNKRFRAGAHENKENE